MEITETNSTATNSGSENALSRLGKDFDSFLTILTTQLQNQDPLSPMDTHQFTNQLVQFASVEQLVSQTQDLDELIELQKANQSVSAVSYIGNRVEAEGSELVLEADGAKFAYHLPEAAQSAGLQILDALGRLVHVQALETDAGRHEVEWDGKDLNGNVLPLGTYSFIVSAVNADDAQIDLSQYTNGTVTGVSFADGQTVLNLGNIVVPVDKVIETVPRLLMGIKESSTRIQHIVANLKHMARHDKGDRAERQRLLSVLPVYLLYPYDAAGSS